MSFLLRTPTLRTVPSPLLARAFSTTPAPRYARTTIIGRLTAAPEERLSANGKQYIRYSVASSSGGNPETRVTSFFNVTNFPRDGASEAQLAHLLGLPKGTLVHVEADTRVRYTEDGEAGQKQLRLDLVQRNLEVLARPRNQGEGEE